MCRYVRTGGNSEQKCSSDRIIFRGKLERIQKKMVSGFVAFATSNKKFSQFICCPLILIINLISKLKFRNLTLFMLRKVY